MEQTNSKISAIAKFDKTQYNASFGDRTSSPAHALIQLKAPELQDEEQARPTVDMTAIIDVSGSMSGSKLDLVIRTLKFLINNLQATDRLALVTFDSNVTCQFPLTEMNQKGRDNALAITKRLQAGTCTNLSGGLFQGMELMQERGRKGDVSSVLLLTDGIANEGMTSTSEITAKMQEMMGERQEYSIYTFGYGRDHNEEMLKHISEIGNGMYYYIESNDVIAESFGDCIGGLLSVFAQNIKVTLKVVADGYRLSSIKSKKKHTLSEDGREASITVGDLQAEEAHDILVELALASLDAGAAHDDVRVCVDVEVKYANLNNKQFETVKTALALARPMEAAEEAVDDDVQKAIVRYETLAKLEEARQLADSNDLLGAQNVLQSHRTYMASAVSSDRFECDAMYGGLMADVDEGERAMSSRMAYNAGGRKAMTTAVQSHGMQRSNRVWGEDEDAEEPVMRSYVLKSKAAFRARAKKN